VVDGSNVRVLLAEPHPLHPMPLVAGSALAVAAGVSSAYCRECVDRVCCGCFGGGRRHYSTLDNDNTTDDKEEFEDLIRFLNAVPLFQKQLSKAELPKIATSLKRTDWQPGERVVAQGENGKAFFIVRAGEASVVVKSGDVESVRATLYYGDYFGGHTLTQNRPNVASIVAKGPMPLVTFSLSREEFERLGLNKELKFPKRPAIYDGRVIEDGQRMDFDDVSPTSDNRKATEEEELTEEEISFISKVIRENPNLRSRRELDRDLARKMAKTAHRRQVTKGSDMLKGGELAREFFVISKGAFKLIPRVWSSATHQSVEAMVANSAVTERLGRKQQFLMGMVRQNNCRLPEGTSFPEDGTASSGLGSRPGRSQSVRMPTLAQKTNLPRRHSAALRVVSPFKVGDTVARLVVGEDLIKEVGTVVEVVLPGPAGEVVVEFPETQGRERILVRYLRPEDARAAATLRSGDCCGEVELLYNTRQMATSRALQDSVVYVIGQHAFKECFRREPPHFKDHCALLNEVHMLTPLLLSERAELARNATGSLSFSAGVRVLRQGEVQPEPLLYVVERGSCRMVRENRGQDDTVLSEELRQLHRAEHFGEDLLVRLSEGEAAAPGYSIDAGPEGVTCLAFDLEILKKFLSVRSTDGHECPVFEFSPRRPKNNSLSAVSLEKLQPIAVLGEGGFGSVFLVKYGEKEYALKRMSKGYVVEAKVAKQIRLERDIFSMVDSDFIVRFFRSYQDAQYVYMLMEYASGGHLWGMMCENWNILRKDNPRGSATRFYVACVVLAFEHLHERHIVYRDLKPENILLDGRGYAKICDLGFARFILGKSHTLVGTPEYMAPEMIDTPHAHDFAVDWWSLGVLTFELITGQAPWDDQAASDTMAQILTIRRGQDHGIPDQLLPSGSILVKDFIKKLLCVNEKTRLGSKRGGAEVKEHSWFTYQTFDFDALSAGTLSCPWTPSHKVIEKCLPEEDGGGLPELDGSLFVNFEGGGDGWEAAF